MSKGWIAVDLDGTLMVWQDNGVTMGAPIMVMVNRVKGWLAKGQEVRVFTARISHKDEEFKNEVVKAIKQWCVENIGQELEVTNVKDFHCIQIWDDKAVRVIKNTGMSEKEYQNRRR